MLTQIEAEEIQRFAARFDLDEDLGDDPRLFAALCAWSYGVLHRPELNGWTAPSEGFTAFDARPNCPVPMPASTLNGYDAGAFLHKASATLIVVNRGTEELDDWDDNLAQFIAGRPSAQSFEALDFAMRAVRRANAHAAIRSVILTGHSLGGGLAGGQFCVLARSLAAIASPVPEQLLGFTFGTAPFKAACLAFEKERFPNDPPTTAFTLLKSWRRPDDPLSAIDSDGSRTLGKVETDLPRVWTVIHQPGPPGAKGDRPWKLRSGTFASHSAFLYYKYFELRSDSHIFLRLDGSHLPKANREPNRPHAFQRKPDFA